MDKIQRLLGLTFLFLFTAVPIASAQQEQQDQPVLVGRVSHLEGELLRYVPDDDDWVATVKDTPVGKDDVFYSDEEVKAEFIIPNNTWIRIGGGVQIQIVKLEENATEIDMDSGIARFYNKSSTARIKAITPYGYVQAPPHTTFDVYLKDESVEVIVLKGRTNFVHVTDDSEYEVIAGSSSIIAGYQEVTSGKGMLNDGWNSWNVKMDALWERRLEVKGDSAKHLPERLYYESHVLDENGVWERVYYEGGYRYFWRPIHVSSSWRPFTAGRWTLWYGDHCWVPYEPFGYVTHHYGNWVYINRCRAWYWAPPVCRLRIGVGPFLHIGFAWYPGRVSWIHRGTYIGWIPLAPYESYYCRRYWGPRSIVVNNIFIINFRKHCYKNHAVVVRRRHFYNVDNYNRVRLRNIGGSSIIDSYRGAAVINSRVMRNFKEIKNRFNFRNVAVRRKPPHSVIKGIQHRKPDGRQFFKGKGSLIQARSAKVTPGKRFKPTSVKRPGVTGNKIISTRETKKPGEIGFKRGQQKMQELIVKRAIPKPEVRKSITRMTPVTKVPKFTPKVQRSMPSFTPRSREPSFTPKSKGPRFTPKSRGPRSTTRSGLRMKR